MHSLNGNTTIITKQWPKEQGPPYFGEKQKKPTKAKKNNIPPDNLVHSLNENTIIPTKQWPLGQGPPYFGENNKNNPKTTQTKTQSFPQPPPHICPKNWKTSKCCGTMRPNTHKAVKINWNSHKITLTTPNGKKYPDKPDMDMLYNNKIGLIDFTIQTVLMNWPKTKHILLPTKALRNKKWEKILKTQDIQLIYYTPCVNQPLEIDHQSWQFHPAIIERLAALHKLKLPTIDMFASSANAITPLYCADLKTPLPHLHDGIQTLKTLLSQKMKRKIYEICQKLQVKTPKTQVPWSNVPFNRNMISSICDTTIGNSDKYPSWVLLPDWNNKYTEHPKRYPALRAAAAKIFLIDIHKNTFRVVKFHFPLITPVL